jgi:hypothetical protein
MVSNGFKPLQTDKSANLYSPVNKLYFKKKKFIENSQEMTDI